MNELRSATIAGGALILLLGAAYTAAGQTPKPRVPYSASASYRPEGSLAPQTPAQRARDNKKVHLIGAARAALHAGDFLAAEDYAQQLIDIDTGSDLGQAIMVEALHGQGRDMDAIPFYQAISEDSETDPQYELPYAMLLVKTGHWAQAVSVYNRTLPFLAEGDLLRAHNDFSPFVQRTKDLETALHIALGMQYVGGSNLAGRIQNDDGLLNFQQALALAPNSSLANYQYGLGLARLGHAAEARSAFKKAAVYGVGDIKKAAQQQLPGAKPSH